MNRPVDPNYYQQFLYTPQYDEAAFQPENYGIDPKGQYTGVMSTVEDVRRKIKTR